MVFYSIPFGIDIQETKDATSVKVLPEETCQCEVLKTVSGMVKGGGIMSLGKKEEVLGIGKVHLGLYVSNYPRRRVAFVFADETLTRKHSIEVPALFNDDPAGLCGRLAQVNQYDQYMQTLDEVIGAVKSLRTVKVEVSHMLKTKIVGDVDTYLTSIQSSQGIENVVSDHRHPGLQAEINNVLSIFTNEDTKLDRLGADIGAVNEAIGAKTQAMTGMLEAERQDRDEDMAEKIEDMIEEFNEEILPHLQARLQATLVELENQIAPLEVEFAAEVATANSWRMRGTEYGFQRAVFHDVRAASIKGMINDRVSAMKRARSDYESAVKAEHDNIESAKRERQKMNEQYALMENRMAERSGEFITKTAKYCESAVSELNKVVDELSIPTDRLAMMSLGRQTAVYIPVYVAPLADTKTKKKRYLVVPPIVSRNGNIKIGPSMFDKLARAVGAESFLTLVSENTKGRLEKEEGFSALCESLVVKSSITDPKGPCYAKITGELKRQLDTKELPRKEYDPIMGLFSK